MGDKEEAAVPNGDLPENEQSELEMLQLSINQKTDESLESTRRMLALCEESKESGIQTLVMLDEQGEQLDNFEEGMDEINRDMLEAEEALEGMEKCCGLFVLPWKKQTKKKDPSDPWGKKSGADGGGNADGPRMQMGDGPMMSGNYITKITNDAREEEMEKNVNEVSGMIGNLHNMAMDMGNEIDSQNKCLDRINAKANVNEARIKDANKRANKLLAD